MPPLLLKGGRNMWKIPENEFGGMTPIRRVIWVLIGIEIVCLMFALGTNAFALETQVNDAWNFDLVKMQKNQIFGWNYQSDYETWFGIKGYGFGFNWGYAGVVFGKKKTLDDLRLPEIFDTVTVDASGTEIRSPTMIELGDLYIDTFTYVNFEGLSAYGLKDMSKWLFWEVALWYGK